MLSFASISTLFNDVAELPLIFILKAELVPPISFIVLNLSFWLFSLMILNDLVIEPVLVKTVSYFKASVVMVSLASALVIKESFLQEESRKQKAGSKKQKERNLFIDQI
jgi:hypothetical protein